MKDSDEGIAEPGAGKDRPRKEKTEKQSRSGFALRGDGVTSRQRIPTRETAPAGLFEEFPQDELSPVPPSFDRGLHCALGQ